MHYGRSIAGVVFVLAASSAQAQTTYTAADGGAGPTDPRPNSNAKAAQFDAAAGLFGIEHFLDFESVPVGTFTNLLAAPGVTISGSDYQGNPLAITNTVDFPTSPPLAGFNTTFGGSNHLDLQGGTATFTFATPVQAFGAYLQGVQPFFFSDTMTFNDGASHTTNLPSADPGSGGVSFVGFTDPGHLISSITFNAGLVATGADFIGIDDVRYVNADTPEPSALALFATSALTGAALLRRRKKTPRSA